MLNQPTPLPALPVPRPLLQAAGCASHEWRQDGASAAETQDLAARYNPDARAEHLRSPALAGRPPMGTVPHQWRFIAMQSPRNDSEHFRLERELFRRCMSAGGHALRPGPKTSP